MISAAVLQSRAVAVVAACLLGSGLCAAPAQARPPVVLNAEWVEHTDGLSEPIAATCAVTVSAMTDGRRDPVTAGNVNGRSVRSPADVQAWMRSVVNGLPRRGVAARFESAPKDAAGAAAQPAGTVTFELRLVWANAAASVLTANVVMAVGTTGPDGQVAYKTYRGTQVNMNWANGGGEIQKLVDQAFGKALDQIAVDLRSHCT